MNYKLLHGDNREQLKHLADNSIDSIVCDPPYELGFMGKRWDSTGIAYDLTVWTECLRVLKPGGHLIAFGGTRTYHRMTVAIEDAGFEIRDCIMWLYGSGFPKSLDVSKALDKHGGVRAEFTQFRDAVIDALKRNGQTRSQLQDALGNFMISHYLTAGSQPAVPNYKDYCIIRDFCKLGDVWDELFKPEAEREVITEKRSDMFGEYEVEKKYDGDMGGLDGIRLGKSNGDITAPATDLAKQWHGYGTALKPAVEPAVLARKPLIGTVADNVTAWGTGAINIDGCRVGLSDGESAPSGSGKRDGVGGVSYNLKDWTAPNGGNGGNTTPPSGRWPANVILDEDAGEALDAQSGVSVSKAQLMQPDPDNDQRGTWQMRPRKTAQVRGHSDSGGASRFFYTAKASKAEREAGLEGMDVATNGVGALRDGGRESQPRANHHPTVKPIALMRYLVRLVTPKGGTVLDPFMGSGSTGCAAMCEGVDFVGIELSEEYLEIARRRIEYWQSQNPMGL